MDHRKNNLLTKSQFTFLIVGMVLGPGFFRLPALVVDKAKQDAWISTIIAIIYPLCIILLSLYVISKYPSDNLLSISKKVFGKFIGTILNIIYLLQYPIFNITMASDTVRIYTTYVTSFLTPLKILLVTVFLSLLVSLKGLKVLGKVNEYSSYIAFFILSFSLYAVKFGSFSNIQPVFGSGWPNILKGCRETSYFYLGFESIILYHPYIYDKKDIAKASFSALLLCSIVWVLVVFLSIQQLGVYLIQMSAWPFVLVLESIRIPLINNFIFFFMFAWSFMAYKCKANYYFTTAFIINDITKIDFKKICFFLFPIIIYFSLLFSDNLVKSKVLTIISPLFVVFNFLFFSIIVIISAVKSKAKN